MSADQIEHQRKNRRVDTEVLPQYTAGRGGAAGGQSLEAFEELQNALEELRVAEEELRQQNEVLAMARVALEEERQRYRDLFEFAPNGYLVTDARATIREVNRVAVMLLNVPQPFLVGKPLITFVEPQDRPRFRSELNQLSEWDREGEWEVRLAPRDRDPVDVALSVAAVRDGGGRPETLRWLVRDITDRKRAEQQIQRLNAELEERVAERTGELRTANDLKDRLLVREQRARTEAETTKHSLAILADASAALASSLDYQTTLERAARLAIPHLADLCVVDASPDESVGETARQSIVAHGDPRLEGQLRDLWQRFPAGMDLPDAVGRVVDTGHAEVVEESSEVLPEAMAKETGDRELLRGVGVCSAFVVPLMARGRILGAISYIYGPSGRRHGPVERTLAEDMARRAALALDNARLHRELGTAYRRKDEFLAMLAHELRNPLAPVLNALHILRLRGNDAAAVERVRGIVERQVRHMSHLIEDLLNVTRIARGKIALRRERLDLPGLVREVAEDHRNALELAGLTFTTSFPGEPVWVMGDRTRLSQVIGNLLQNALKFTNPGGRVAIRVARLMQDPVAAITVTDTGIGMEPELLRSVFQTFIQADRSLDRSQGGLGLGLALVKGLVELHGGEVRAFSAGPGRGAEFTVLLPLHDPRTATPAPEEPPSSAEAQGPAAGNRVLVIEDNQDAAETLREWLQMSGYTVEVAFSGPAGVEAARRCRPDVVLCDLGLPGMDGYAVATELRRDAATATTRLIALSGYGDEDDRRRAQEAGFERHLTKPVAPAELERLLAEG